MRPSSFSRERIGEAIILILLSSYFVIHTLPRAWGSLNTDFPNYYLAARLTRERVDPARAYEWIWLQREKDHRGIDQRVVGLVPITPISTLILWPVAQLPPLTAKQVWLVFNFALLVLVAFVLRSVSGLSLMQIGILFALSVPLYRNILYGQYYIVLLLLLGAACWAAQRQYRWRAGFFLGLAAAVKIFPILLALYFLRKKDWRAICSCVFTIAATFALSVSVFGWALHRTYLLQVLPWTLRGECLDPYNLHSGSLSVLLHRLFVYEPQWNPHPVIHLPWLLALLHPLLQLAILAPIVLLVDADAMSPRRIGLEWSALLIAILTVSTLPASYHFTVLILPAAVLCGDLLHGKRHSLLLVVLMIFLSIGYYGWNTEPTIGWHALAHVPRLYALVIFTISSAYLLYERTKLVWGNVERRTLAALCAGTAISIFSGLRQQRHQFDDYAWRLPVPMNALIMSRPATSGSTINAVSLLSDGYHITQQDLDGLGIQQPWDDPLRDQLSFAFVRNTVWTESVADRSTLNSSTKNDEPIADAESPVFSLQTGKLAFLRTVRGRKKLFLRDLNHPDRPDRPLTPLNTWNVDEQVFQPDGSLIVSARINSGSPALYVIRDGIDPSPISVGEARYPAISPDGHWLVFSRFQAGNWNLYLREMSTGSTRRLTNVPCNQIESSWEPDSETLLYSSDCGRALWFTAICRRRILP